MQVSPYEQVKQVSLVLLKSHSTPTSEIIRNAVQSALSIVTNPDGVDKEELAREIESLLNTWSPEGTELRDDTGHIPWLHDRKASVLWDFWRRYQTYLEQDKGLPPQIVTRLDQLTDSILEKLEDPRRSGRWDRRGMVVGQVQSGKTANYTGLICKAVDAGYKLIIVLAGMHNSLRSQTQLRLDEGFLGRDTKLSRVFTQDNGQIGVGNIPTARKLAAHSLTTSAEDGDFRKNKAKTIAVYIGSDPVILVVKKNKSVLDNLLQWVQATVGEVDPSGKRVVRNIPLLLLDDEADNASVNTNPLLRDEHGEALRDQDVTAINGLIRKLLNTFEQSAYVGYTATPFANIFIYPEGETDEHGEDLFPRSFIINLPAPSNYIGPARVFGLQERRDIGIDGEDGLPIVKIADDFEHVIPTKHKQNLTLNALPQSMQKAIRSFVISCAARYARGQMNEHNSMLIHVTRFNAVQKIVQDLVVDEMVDLKRRLEFGDGKRNPSLLDEMKLLWEQDFVPIMSSIQSTMKDHRLKPLSWQDVNKHLFAAAAKIQIRLVNGTAADVLDYYDHPNGVSVIAIGGDKLSRGLTLEGLSTSYYLRASRMYDTLMQMGRWFGYRPGYIDLCRLYTSQDLADWYKHIAEASEELRSEFDRMALAGQTPMDFGLKVRTHSGGLTVTGVGKMRSGTKMRVSFAMSLAESHAFHKDQGIIQQNYLVTDAFLKTLKLTTHPNNIDYWCTDVPGARVASFLGSLTGHPQSRRSDPQKLQEYIEKKLTHNELEKWTVVLINNKSVEKSKPVSIGGKSVGLSTRNPSNDSGPDHYNLIRRHLLSGEDEELDLSDEERVKALELTKEAWAKQKGSKEEPKTASQTYVRAVRPSGRGLLLIYPLDGKAVFGEDYTGRPFIGFAASFPDTKSPDEAVEYVVNNIYWNEEFGEE